MRRHAQRIFFILGATAFAMLVLMAPAVFAKKAPAATGDNPGTTPGSTADATKANLNATFFMASLKVGRVVLAEDASFADVKDTLGGIYDREEAAVTSGLRKLKDAADAKARADAAAIINGADDECGAYYKKNPTVHDRMLKRSKDINAELGQMAKSADAYVAALEKVGVGPDVLAKAKPIVADASKKSGGKVEGDGIDSLIDARRQVHAMMSARQLRQLPGQFSGK